MKYARALRTHVYAGKRRNPDDVFPVRRMDYRIYVAKGDFEIVPNPADALMEYRTTTMEAEPEPVKVKRKYTRKKVVE